MVGIRSWVCDNLTPLPVDRAFAPVLSRIRNRPTGGRTLPDKRPMIARSWRGWTKTVDAKAYEQLLRDEIFPSISAQNINGYHGAELFIREDGDKVEFITLLRFDSMDAVKEFSGADAS